MTVADRKLAIEGVAGFARLYPDDTKAVCDCERYLSKQRWLDVESIDEKPQEFIPYPKQELGDKVRSFAKLITIPSYKSWFIKNGECIISQKNGKVIIKATTSITETEIRKRFTSHLSLVFGANGYEFEIQNDLRRDAG